MNLPTQQQDGSYEAHEARLMTRHLKVGCLLVATLMPLGAVLDWYWFKYSYGGADLRGPFFLVRLGSSAAALVILVFLRGTHTHRWHSLIGLAIAYIPVVTICWMIYATNGSESPYYAGLNLVLLAIAFVLQWGTVISSVGVVLVLATYLAACVSHGPIHPEGYGTFVNNIYFLTLTGLIVVVGSAVHARLRRREFEAQRQLDQNLLQIEQSRIQLASRNQELERALNQLNAAEVQLLQSEKLALLGELSAGIIHEINNPLNTAKQGIYALKQKASALDHGDGGECQSIITLVEEGVQRVVGIVGSMRQFAYPEQGAKERVLVADVVETSLRLLVSEWKADGVQVQQTVSTGLLVWANRNGLVHLLINLLKNALDALKDGRGDERIPTIWIEARASDRWAILSVRDNGPGIAVEHQSRVADVLGMGADGRDGDLAQGQGRVFRHFFTTKGAGAGMGMGLGICRRIVQAQNGRIRFRSTPGESCEFTVELPLADSIKVAV
jgi:two-component system sensor histidine kinase PhcS